MGLDTLANETLFRFFHILSGITWIGLLYFFNLVNLPLLKFDMKKPFTVNMAEKATANITLKTLWWFRYGALFTVLFGALLLEVKRAQFGSMGAYFFEQGPAGHMILMGVTFGLIMAANVWFIIWPNQQVILANNKKIGAGEDKDGALAADNAPRVKKAVMASRTNTWLSIPMLFGMVFGAHGAGIGQDWGTWIAPLGVLGAVLLLMIGYSTQQKKE